MTDVKILNGHNIKDETARNGLLAKQDIIQYSTMPGASAEYENKVVQYIGSPTRQYQTGCFYKCYHDVIPRYDIDTYIWSYVDIVEFTPATIVPTTTNFVTGTRYSARTAFQKTADLFGGLQGEIDTVNGLIPNQATTQNQLADKAFVNTTVATNTANFRGNWVSWDSVPIVANEYPEDYTGSRTPTNNDYMVVDDMSDYTGDIHLGLTINTTDTSTNPAIDVVVPGDTTYHYVNSELSADDWTGIGNTSFYIKRGSDNGVATYELMSGEYPMIIDGTTYDVSDIYFWRASVEYTDKEVTYYIPKSGSWLFVYDGDWAVGGVNNWKIAYKIETAFTQAQMAAINSNITAEMVADYLDPESDVSTAYNKRIDALETDKQDTLVSGTNIKTINNTSILGSGNINTFPIQTSQAGKFLSTNGTSTSWENLPTATPTSKGIVRVGNALEIDNGVLTNKYKYLTSLPDPEDFNQNNIIFCNDEKKILFCSSGVPVGATISMTPTPSDPAALTVNAVKFYEHLIGSHFNFIGVMPPIEATIEIGMTGWVCECNGYYSETQDPENDFGITIASADDQPGNVIRVRVYNAAGTGHKAWRLWQPTPIEDNLLTNSRTSALSANQGVLLKQMIDQQQALGRFLALWDSDTGTARYLNNGFGYERGDYFIISNIGIESLTPVYTEVSGHIADIKVVDIEGWVNEMGDSNQTVRFVYSAANNGWEYNGQYYDMQDLGITYAGAADSGDIMDITYVNGKNYKPNGDEYTGASTTLTTDPVHVSDMWFYDGEHWVYLENHEVAQIIDSALSPTSENPVQNKVVTNALRNKQATLTAGDNINISYSGDTCTISSTGGGVGVPEITDVFPITVRNQNALSDEEWKLRYSPIYISTNLTIQQIIENATQQYVTISKYSKNNRKTHGRARGKMTVMNDRRVRLDHKMYCWRKSVDTALAPENPQRYHYVYTDTDDWDDDCSLFASLGFMDCANSATNLNCLKDTGYTMSGFQVDVDFFRYPQGDINTCIREQHNGSPLIDRFIIGTWTCSEYRKDGKTYYVWRDSPTSNSVFMYISDSEFIPDYTPKFFDELSEIPASTIATYTFVRERKDLNFAKFDFDTYDLSELATDVYFYTVFGQTGDTHMPWDNYWFDFPITPVLLSECKIFVPETTGISWSNHTMTIKDFIKNLTLSNLEVSDIFDTKDLVKIEIPYDTYYILMRLCAWQKMCFEDDSWSSKFDFQEAINNGAFEKRAFGSPRGHTWRVNSEHTAINIYLEFNLAEPDCVVTGKPSRSKPVKKRLRLTTSKGNQTIKD